MEEMNGMEISTIIDNLNDAGYKCEEGHALEFNRYINRWYSECACGEKDVTEWVEQIGEEQAAGRLPMF